MRTPDRFESRRGVAKLLRVGGGTRRHHRQSRQPSMESLESRCLLTAITEYKVPLVGTTSPGPSEIAIQPNGTAWFIESASNTIGTFSVTSPNPQTSNVAVPASSLPSGITVGPDGNSVYFTELAASQIGKFSSTDSAHTLTNDPVTAGSGPVGLTTANGSVWVTQNQPKAAPPGQPNAVNRISEIDSSAHVTETLLPNKNMTSVNSRIVRGPDGNLWFTERGFIGVFNPVSKTLVKEVPLPGGSTEVPFGIAVGPDGNIWYTEAVFNATFSGFLSLGVGLINPTSQSVITEIPVSGPAEPFGITAGPDGNLWFAVASNGTSPGTIDEIIPQSNPLNDTINQTLAIPTTAVSIPNPTEIVPGPDGNLWFTDGAGAIGKVNLNVQPHFVVTTPPPANATAGVGFGFTVTAEYGSNIVDSLCNGNATVSLASNPGGAPTTLGGLHKTVTAAGGVATFSGLTLDTAANGYTLAVSSTGTGAPATGITSGFNVVGAAATRLLVISPPPGSVPSGYRFSFTVAAVDQFYNLAPSFNGTVTVTLSATNPGGSGAVLSGLTTLTISPSSAIPGLAIFSGLSLTNLANGYVLTVSASPNLIATTAGPINVTAPLPPPTIVGKSVVFTQKLNKKTHKPMGPKSISGYVITFDTTMDQTALHSAANYTISKVVKTVKEGGKKYIPVRFSASAVTSNSVTLKLVGKQPFPKGGQLTVFAAGLDDSAGVFLAANGVFTLSKGGKQIS
jgi:streptogramin lyase